MRILRIVAIGATVFGLAVAGILALDHWLRDQMYYPSAADESAFLRAYDSKRVVQPFMASHESFGEGRGSSQGAGRKSVTHDANFDEYFTMQTDREPALMTALRDDVSERLRHSGAQVINQYGSPSTGFHFDYRTANTIGSVSIHPLAQGKVQRNLPLEPGLEDVTLDIEIAEQWFPHGIPVLQAAIAGK